MITKVGQYFIKYGPKATLRKVRSLIAAKILPSNLITSNYEKTLDDIPNVEVISTNKMNDDYKSYIDIQIKKSVSRTIYLNPAKRLIMSRDNLIQNVKNVSSNWEIKCDNILSIGSRDDREIDNIQSLFITSKVTGLDLFSASKRIISADMHSIPFKDSEFDITISIHCQEHSYDPNKSLGEMFRLTKSKGLICIEVPVNFQLSKTDRVDYKNLQNLISYFPAGSVEILWSELENRFSKPTNLRTILQKI